MTFSKLFEYIILCSQIYGRFIILFTKHDYKVLASFLKEKQRYKWLKKAKWISVYSVASKHTQKKTPKKKKKTTKCLEETHDFRQNFDELLSYRF